MTRTKTVTVYGASSTQLDDSYTRHAYQLGELLANNGWIQLNGGAGQGLMGAATDGALAAGGIVDVVLLDIFVTRMHHRARNVKIVSDMTERKKGLFDPADAFISLPGGLGTLEELAEIISWRQLDFHNKPIVLLNTNGFYDPLRSFFELMVQGKFAIPEMLTHCIKFADTPQQAVDYLNHYVPIKFREKHELLGELTGRDD